MTPEQIANIRAERKSDKKKRKSESSQKTSSQKTSSQKTSSISSSQKTSSTSSKRRRKDKRKIGLNSPTSTEKQGQTVTDSTTSETPKSTSSSKRSSRKSRKSLSSEERKKIGEQKKAEEMEKIKGMTPEQISERRKKRKQFKKAITESPTSTDVKEQTITDSTTSQETPNTVSSPSPSSRISIVPETTTELTIESPKQVNKPRRRIISTTSEAPVETITDSKTSSVEDIPSFEEKSELSDSSHSIEEGVDVPVSNIKNSKRINDTRKKIFEISSELPATSRKKLPILNPIEEDKPLYDISSIINKEKVASLSEEDVSKAISAIISHKIKADQRQKAAKMIEKAREDYSLLNQNGGDDDLIQIKNFIPKIKNINEEKRMDINENFTEYDSPTSVEFNKKYINSFGLSLTEDSESNKLKGGNKENGVEINGKVIINKFFDYIGVKFN